jgi:3-hydroxybutyryl-CoA dehydratase
MSAEHGKPIAVGAKATLSRTVSAEDVELFGKMSGDRNPIHFDEEYAKTTRFKTRIAHGMLTASYFSTILSATLPGPGTIYLGQTLRFKAPVKIGDTVTATMEVASIDAAKRRATLSCIATVGETVVIEGEASVMLPDDTVI